MNGSPDIVVVIPAYHEKTLKPTLGSLKAASTDFHVLIHVVFNAPSDAQDHIVATNLEAQAELEQVAMALNSSSFRIQSELHHDLDPKKAGVGLARKIGMDYAANLFRLNEKDGIVVALDADCLVSENYFDAIASYFAEHPSIRACNLYFEHRFSKKDTKLREAAIQYELHLRYFKQCLQFIAFPQAYHTVGSCMALRSETYLKSGGMNARQAGEDFYFLQKLFSQYPFGEINEATVYPDGRFSNRVPFGTGAALLKWKEQGGDVLTYSFSSFLEIGEMLKIVIAEGDPLKMKEAMGRESVSRILTEFLRGESFEKEFEKMRIQSNSMDVFRNHFFRWFNNFKILKCLNYLREHKYPMGSVMDESKKLLKAMDFERPESALDLLVLFRNLDKINIAKQVE